MTAEFWTRLLSIVFIDLTLAGDNALVIALAVRSLPRERRFWARMLGTGAAVGAVNGLVLVYGKLPHPFIITLATLSVARGKTAEAGRVRPVHVLGGIDGRGRARKTYAGRKRSQQNDAVDRRVTAQPAQNGVDLLAVHRVPEVHDVAADPHLRRRGGDRPDVPAGRLVRGGDHDSQPRYPICRGQDRGRR